MDLYPYYDYDNISDCLYVYFGNGDIAVTVEVSSGEFMIDLDAYGRCVGVEFINPLSDGPTDNWAPRWEDHLTGGQAEYLYELLTEKRWVKQ